MAFWYRVRCTITAYDPYLRQDVQTDHEIDLTSNRPLNEEDEELHALAALAIGSQGPAPGDRYRIERTTTTLPDGRRRSTLTICRDD